MKMFYAKFNVYLIIVAIIVFILLFIGFTIIDKYVYNTNMPPIQKHITLEHRKVIYYCTRCNKWVKGYIKCKQGSSLFDENTMIIFDCGHVQPVIEASSYD